MNTTVDHKLKKIRKELKDNIKSKEKLLEQKEKLEILQAMCEFSPDNSISDFIFTTGTRLPLDIYELDVGFRLNDRQYLVKSSSSKSGLEAKQEIIKDVSNKIATIFTKTLIAEINRAYEG